MNSVKKKRWLPAALTAIVVVLTIVLFVMASGTTSSAAGSRTSRLPARPDGTTVVDDGDYLSLSTIDTIDRLNEKWSQTDERLQVAVYITKELPSDDLEDFSNELFRKWQVGYKDTNNGVLLVVDISNRKFRIETSDNASTRLRDIEANDILENSRPYFRSEDYDGGILYIVEAIGDHYYGTQNASELAEPSYEEDSSDDDGFGWGQVVFWIIIILVFIFFDGGSGGTFFGGGSGFSGGSSGGSSGGYSGGGGWSGGGGGGGGASSGW